MNGKMSEISQQSSQFSEWHNYNLFWPDKTVCASTTHYLFLTFLLSPRRWCLIMMHQITNGCLLLFSHAGSVSSSQMDHAPVHWTRTFTRWSFTNNFLMDSSGFESTGMSNCNDAWSHKLPHTISPFSHKYSFIERCFVAINSWHGGVSG